MKRLKLRSNYYEILIRPESGLVPAACLSGNKVFVELNHLQTAEALMKELLRSFLSLEGVSSPNTELA